MNSEQLGGRVQGPSRLLMAFGLPGSFEIARAAQALVGELFRVQAGETVIVTADPSTDQLAVEAILTAASGMGGIGSVVFQPGAIVVNNP